MVLTLPFEMYWPSASLNNIDLCSGVLTSGSDDILNVLVPTLNLRDGGGLERGSSKKKLPNTSPKVSETNFTSDTVACALLVWPNRVMVPVLGI